MCADSEIISIASNLLFISILNIEWQISTLRLIDDYEIGKWVDEIGKENN
jgi:hypothetical protein